MEYAKAQKLILDEYVKALGVFSPMASSHEGYAVILEELDELWDDIKSERSRETLAHEAKQIGAMALRFLVDCC